MSKERFIQTGIILLLLGVTLVLIGGKGCPLIKDKDDDDVITGSSGPNNILARPVAEAGINWANTHIQTLLAQQGPHITHTYYGEDLNCDGVLTGGLEQYENQDNDNVLQGTDCPLSRAVRPSFMADIGGDEGNPDGQIDENDLILVAGKKIGVSGFTTPTYTAQGDFYALKVEDLSGRIFVNGVEDDDEYKVLKQILGNLTDELFGNDAIGQIIAQGAPYTSYNAVRTRLIGQGIVLSDTQFNQLKACISLYAWRDTSVIKPTPLIERIGNESGLPPRPGDDIFNRLAARSLLIDHPTKTTYGSGREIVGRAPVNINSASTPVLVALLRNLGGLYLDEDVDFTWYPDLHNHLIGYRYSFNPYEPTAGRKGNLGILCYTPEITQEQAITITNAIIQNRSMVYDSNYPWRGTFRSWCQFGLFCDKVLVEGMDHGIPSGFLSRQQADVLKANFNPNSNLLDFNPPYQRRLLVDKANLWLFKQDIYGMWRSYPGYSTEFTFLPTGYFEITSRGRILNTNQAVVSEAEASAVVRLWGMHKESTQKEFLEDFWTREEPIDEVISNNTGGSLQTTQDDLTLQVYPEILEYEPGQPGYCRVPDLGQSEHMQNPYVQDAHYDGYITLVTVENMTTTPLSDFRVSYSEYGLNASTPTDLACVIDTRGPYENRLVPPSNLTAAERSAFRAQAGTLFPDGVYSELDTVPAYDYRPTNLNIFTTSLWLKPHFLPESSSKCRTWFTYQVFLDGATRGASAFASNPIAPLGIYSIPGDTEDLACDGIDRNDRWDNSSFFVGGKSTQEVNSEFGGGLVSCCLNHIPHQCKVWPSHPSHATCGGKVTDPEGNQWKTLYRAGKWIHLSWIHHAWPAEATSDLGDVDMWDAHRFLYSDIDRFYINGKNVSCIQSYWVNHCNSDLAYQAFADLAPLLRLGGRRNQFGVPDNEVRLNSAPDGTIDETLIWDGLEVDQGSSVVRDVWSQGRYYRKDDGVFTSRSINLAQALSVTIGTPITVCYMAWTQYVPEEKWTVNGVQSALPLPGEALAPTCEVEFWNEAKDSKIGVRKSVTTQPAPSGEIVKDNFTNESLVVTDPIRYRVKFLPNVDPLNHILIDTIIFDDITIIFHGPPEVISLVYE